MGRADHRFLGSFAPFLQENKALCLQELAEICAEKGWIKPRCVVLPFLPLSLCSPTSHRVFLPSSYFFAIPYSRNIQVRKTKLTSRSLLFFLPSLPARVTPFDSKPSSSLASLLPRLQPIPLRQLPRLRRHSIPLPSSSRCISTTSPLQTRSPRISIRNQHRSSSPSRLDQGGETSKGNRLVPLERRWILEPFRESSSCSSSHEGRRRDQELGSDFEEEEEGSCRKLELGSRSFDLWRRVEDTSEGPRRSEGGGIDPARCLDEWSRRRSRRGKQQPLEVARIELIRS